MLTLAFDTSSDYSSVAIGLGEEILREKTLYGPHSHQERLFPLIDELLKEVGKVISEIELIVVGIGPGSYTGVRIGVTSARGLSQSLKIPLIGISSLDAIAFNFFGNGELVCPLVDAKRLQVYFSLYRLKNGFRRVSGYQVAYPQEVKEVLKKRKEKIILAGNGIKVYQEIFKNRNFILSSSEKWLPYAANLISLHFLQSKEGFVPQSLMEVTPIYLRLSYAEEGLIEARKRKKS